MVAAEKPADANPTPNEKDATPDTPNTPIDPKDIDQYVFMSQQVSMEPNTDDEFTHMGVVHVTDSAGINVLREGISGLANFFGSKGIENAVYDYARNGALKKLVGVLKTNQKVCNLRMDMDVKDSMVFVHMYGNLYENESEEDEEEEEEEEEEPSSTPSKTA